ncbi:MAG: thermonuclease family protein [Burkholderiales bacterium]
MIAVHDGDTITVLDREHIQHRVRLGGIDAPENGQRYSRAARNELARRVFERWVRVEWNKIDAYGRLIGKVTQAGQDAGRDQLAAGMAWWLRPFAYEQSLADQQEYADVEARAREQRRGLWRDRNPVPPWVWRRKHPDGSRSRATQPDRGTSAQSGAGGGGNPRAPTIFLKPQLRSDDSSFLLLRNKC